MFDITMWGSDPITFLTALQMVGCSCSSGLNSILINSDSNTWCSGGKNDHCRTATQYFYACA